MRLKAGKNLTTAGKRKGRRPKYLSDQQLTNPLPTANRELNKGGPTQALLSLRDTLFIIKLVQAKHRHPAASQKQLAYELLKSALASQKTEYDLAAVQARIRRVTGDGIDKLPTKKQKKRGVFPKTECL